jgi:hypothetical protein
MMGAEGLEASRTLIEEPLTESAQETVEAISITAAAVKHDDP